MNKLAIDSKENCYTGDTDYLSSLQAKIQGLREKLYRYAESIMPPLGNILVDHYKERLRCAEGQPMLGEYAEFIAGDLFLIKPHVVDQLAFPWLLLYEYSLLLDDLLDKSRSNWAHELLLSQILLESSITEYKKVFADNKPLWSAYGSYRRESIYGMMHEMERLNSKERQSRTGAIIQQGRKAALVKFCVTSIMYLDKNRLLTSKEEKVIDHLLAGIQLLDDLTDTVEDHRGGRLNVLLEETYEWFKDNVFNVVQSICPKDISDNQLMVGLVYSGALRRSWKTAAEQIDKALDLLTDVGNKAAKYFSSISIKCRESSILIDGAMRDKLELKDAFICAQVKREPAKILDIRSAKISEVWERITYYINSGPKASQ